MDKRIVFKKKPIPIPAEYRPMYQIALIVLVLKYCCRSCTSSLLKLHLFSWCLYSKNNMEILMRFIDNGYRMGVPHWTIDPALNRALDLAIADGFCENAGNNRYRLTSKGHELASKLEEDKELLVLEKNFLIQIGRGKISESCVDKMTIKELEIC